MLIDYYQSSTDGNTLRFDCESIDELQSLKSVFQSLDSGHLDRVDLAHEFNAVTAEVSCIYVTRVARRDFRECEVTMSGLRKFVWRPDALDLARYVGLIDALLCSDIGADAYQILTSDTAECIAVEIPKPKQGGRSRHDRLYFPV